MGYHSRKTGFPVQAFNSGKHLFIMNICSLLFQEKILLATGRAVFIEILQSEKIKEIFLQKRIIVQQVRYIVVVKVMRLVSLYFSMIFGFALIICFLTFLSGCDDSIDSIITEEIHAAENGQPVPAGDALPPLPGNSGVITVTDIDHESVSLEWAAAADTVTPEEELAYMVYMSDFDDIDTVETVPANGVAYTSGWVLDMTSIVIRGLEPESLKYYNVLVKDAAGNTAAYTMCEARTEEEPDPGSDTEPPVLVNNGLLTIFQIQDDSVKIKWQKPTDNVTAQDDLEYRMVYSLLPNIDTESAIFTALYSHDAVEYTGGWTTGLNNELIDGLDSGTLYYFNVIVRDEADNRAVFSMVSATTSD